MQGVIGMNIEECKKVFDEHGGMVRSKHLQEENIFYRQLQKLIEQGYVEKVRNSLYGYCTATLWV